MAGSSDEEQGLQDHFGVAVELHTAPLLEDTVAGDVAGSAPGSPVGDFAVEVDL